MLALSKAQNSGTGPCLFKVQAKKARTNQIILPLEADHKPLTASITAHGGPTGLLASFYDPEAHAWVVKHCPVEHPHPALTVTVHVISLFDPLNLYDVHVAMASLMEECGAEDRVELERRSQRCHTSTGAWCPLPSAELPDTSAGTSGVITISCPLPTGQGFALCGGGFYSHYPILSAQPALAQEVESRLFDRLMRSGLMEESVGDVGGGVGVGVGGSGREYTSWSVTAAPNAGLACFAIGLRRRSPSELRQQLRGGASPPTHKTEDQRKDLITSLVLREGIHVAHPIKNDAPWRIELPPPHGVFSHPLTPCKEIERATNLYYYHNERRPKIPTGL